MRNKIIPYNSKLKEYARHLRKNSTLTEIIIWKLLKNRSFGVQFHRQVPLVEYIVDFYCHELQLAIEIDGNSHEYKYDYDICRQGILESHGLTFLRFTDFEVKKDIFSIEMTIREKVNELSELHP